METSKLANASLDDIVFAGRNKAYGAYLLRKLYNSHIIKAAIIATLLFFLFISIPLIQKLVAGEEETEVIDRVVTEVELAQPPPIDEATPPPPPPPPDLPPPPPPVRATVNLHLRL
jgi:periplasmic protein TonB